MKEIPLVQSVVFGIVILLVGMVLGAVIDPYLPTSISNAKKGYQAGFDAAREVIKNSSLAGVLTPSNLRTLSGRVTSVGANQITIHYTPSDPFADPALADRTILVNSSTNIVKLTQIDPKVFQTEMAAFLKAVETSSSTPTQSTLPSTPPSSSTAVTISLTDIKVGDAVTVMASENIGTAKEFTASEIQVQPQAATTSPSTTSTKNK